MCFNNNTQKKKWHLFSRKSLYIATICFVVITVLSAWMFFWNRKWYWFNEDYVLDNDLWGTFGDFIGGVFGTFLAFIGVIITCFIFHKQQTLERASQKSQMDQSNIQRFNSLFFELIELHRRQVESLFDTPMIDFYGNQNKEGDFFIRCMQELHSKVSPNRSYATLANVAQRKFLQLYLSNAAVLAPYFRVLYRLFELIDKEKIEEKEKVRYAKIARAQLSEGELFMLRYNSATPYGQKFIEYINKYRLLKHLPILSLLEFCRIRDIISNGDSLYQYSLNMMFFTISKRIYNITVGHEKRPQDYVLLYDERKKYRIELNMAKERRTALVLTIDNNAKNSDPLLKCFRNFQPNDFKDLLIDLLLEIYKYSNYSRYNSDDEIEYKSKIFQKDNITKVVCMVYHLYGKKLRVSHPSRDNIYFKKENTDNNVSRFIDMGDLYRKLDYALLKKMIALTK